MSQTSITISITGDTLLSGNQCVVSSLHITGILRSLVYYNGEALLVERFRDLQMNSLTEEYLDDVLSIPFQVINYN